MSTRSFWLDEPAPPLPKRRLSAPPDVVVAGGGVTGCSCALALAQVGLRVRLHEAREIAGGASGRNGGFALRGGAAPYPVMVEAIGHDDARRLWRLTEEALDRMEELGGDAFARTGSLRLAVDDEEAEELRVEYEGLRDDGFAVEWAGALAPPLSERFTASMLHPPDGTLQPASFVRRLAIRAAEAGVEINERSRLASLESIDTGQIVVATDGYPSGLLGELEGLIIPTRGQMIATEPIADRLFELPHYGRHGFDYWHQRPDGRILAGGFRDSALHDEFTTVEATTPGIQHALEAFVNGLVGRPLEVTHRWAGLFGFVPDFLPVVGRVPGEERTWVAGGYSGHGNVLGFLCGRLVADAVLGRPAPELALFDPARLL